MNKKFVALRDAFIQKYEKLAPECDEAEWSFYINSTDENMQKYSAKQERLDNFLKDRKLYAMFRAISPATLSKQEQNQLNFILRKIESANSSKTELDDMELNISQKYNSYVPMVEGKETSATEIASLLQTERNPFVRKKFYDAKLRGGDLIADDMKQLVIKRNEYARRVGYGNYFEYKLKKGFEVDSCDLANMMEMVSCQISQQMSSILGEQRNNLKKIFDVKTLEPYHYDFLPEDSIDNKTNQYFRNVDDIINIAKETYKGMGYNIDELIKNGNLTLDLLPRKNKNAHGFTFWVYPGKDNRILANLSNNLKSLKILDHELGHCVYDLNYEQSLCFLDKQTHPVMTEAVAMLMESIHKKENTLRNVIPAQMLGELKATYAKDEILFIARALTFINFEKEMYENPDRDLAILWRNTRVKYMGADKDETPDNQWATIPHFLSFPAYYQNYFRASIIKAQMYEHLNEQLGLITENSQTASYLKKHLFQYGVTMSENELIKEMTGKELSCDAFIRSVCQSPELINVNIKNYGRGR